MWHQMWGWDDSWGVGWAMFSLVHVLWWVVIIALAVVVVRAATGQWRRRGDSALDILRERYARGEIDAAEYAERSKQLQGQRKSVSHS